MGDLNPIAPCRDTMWDGKLVLWQPGRKGGYRFNLDPILLAGFVAERPGPLGHLLELGAGCGILSLMLVATGRAQRVTAVERQPQLAHLLRRNVQENGLAHRITVVQGDLREVALPGVDGVVFNPPYFKQGHGLASPDPGRDAGRREMHGTLDDFIACGHRMVTPTGFIAAILPRARVPQWRTAAQTWGLYPGRERAVQAVPGGPIGHQLVTLSRQNEQQTHSAPPLVVHAPPGRTYSPEVQALMVGVLPQGVFWVPPHGSMSAPYTAQKGPGPQDP
jgi:tRNA1Val (adenine37-N6)-methyltransferase